jgi:hypothetical protein
LLIILPNEIRRSIEGFFLASRRLVSKQWATQNFGSANAAAMATILDEYYRLNTIVRPEHLDRTTSGFDFVGNGDEAQQRLDDFAARQASADGLYAQLPANQINEF